MRAGMFGIVSSDGNITNLSLIDLNVTGKIYAGGLVGYLSGKVSKCYVSGTLNASGSSNGGMFGTISNTGLVEQCASEVDVRRELKCKYRRICGKYKWYYQEFLGRRKGNWK